MLNDFLGNSGYRYVATGNLLASRVASWNTYVFLKYLIFFKVYTKMFAVKKCCFDLLKIPFYCESPLGSLTFSLDTHRSITCGSARAISGTNLMALLGEEVEVVTGAASWVMSSVTPPFSTIDWDLQSLLNSICAVFFYVCSYAFEYGYETEFHKQKSIFCWTAGCSGL